MKWYLKSVDETDREMLVNIASVPFVIGRADDCDLKLTDKRISRYHSEIRISSDLIWIRDLNSKNGTFINQNRIDQAQLIEPDDVLSIGRYNFKVYSISQSSSYSFDESETIYETLSEDLRYFDLIACESKFQNILRNRRVIPHFQPLIRFSDMAKVGYEILGRIGDEELPSNPAELLDMANFLGLDSELSSLFREVGVEIGNDFPGSPILFVNSTKAEIHQMEPFLSSMQKIQDIAHSNKVVLEINEKAVTTTNEFSILCNNLRKINIGLAFDDFGVGQTRLVELSNTPPDYLKFDISLVREIHFAPKRLQQMISTFIKASHDLGIITLAEGIECSEESEVCQQLGFDFGQGYFFGRPAPYTSLALNIEDAVNHI